MHPGIEDNVLFSFNASNKYYKIQEIIKNMKHLKLMEKETRLDMLKKIIITLQHIPIETFDDFETSLTLACKIHLLRDVSPIVIELNKTLSIIFDRDVTNLVQDPVKLHLVANNLFDFLQNDLDLIYIVGNISFYNNFSYFVSLSLLWAALNRVAEIQINLFRLYELKDLYIIIKKFPADLIENHTLFYRILSLISIFQNVYILRDHSSYNYEKYSNFFQFEKSDVEELIVWLNSHRSSWESKSKVFNPSLRIEHIDGKSKLATDMSLEITELLVVDIIGLFESLDYNKCCI